MEKICYVVTLPVTIRAFFLPQLFKLAESGYDVTVICSPDDTIRQDLGDVNYVPVNIPRGIALKDTILAIMALYKHFCCEQYDLVQYSTPNAAFCAAVAARLAGIKCRNYHLMGFRYLGAKGAGKFALKVLEKTTCANSTSIECVSKSNLELGVKEGIFPKGKAKTVWNGSTGGVDRHRFDFNKREQWRKEIRLENDIQEDEFVYGFAGRITKDKGINELLQAFLQINNRSKLLLIGNIERRELLNEELLQRAIQSDRIIMIPFTESIERYYAAMDVLVLPSYREGFGNVIIEAAAVGTPAIITDIPGPVDCVLQDQTAFVVNVRDSIALENAMIRMANTDYKNMGYRAKNYVIDTFEQDRLNEYILKQKKTLLGD